MFKVEDPVNIQMFVVLFFLLCTIEPTDFALPTELTNIIAAHVSGVFRNSFNLYTCAEKNGLEVSP